MRVRGLNRRLPSRRVGVPRSSVRKSNPPLEDYFLAKPHSFQSSDGNGQLQFFASEILENMDFTWGFWDGETSSPVSDRHKLLQEVVTLFSSSRKWGNRGQLQESEKCLNRSIATGFLLFIFLFFKNLPGYSAPRSVKMSGFFRQATQVKIFRKFWNDTQLVFWREKGH